MGMGTGRAGIRIASWAATALALTLGGPASAQRPGEARAHVARAVEWAGGEAALREVRRVALDMMTQWQRINFRAVPFTDRPSFEKHFDVRDYTLPAWRNTRDFGARKIVNVVADSVAVTDFGQGFGPLSVAYVDEREELFTYTPDRLLLALVDAPDLASEPDTLIGGETHHVVSATLNGRYPSRVYFHAGTGLPTLLRFRSAHPNDFGLVQWGPMAVGVWYSGWRTFGPVAIPTQWDITRVGSPYKRMTVLRADFAPDFASADSFTVAPELRAEYWASSAPLPMHESVAVQDSFAVDDALVVARSFGAPGGAVDTGEGWLLIGAGQAPFNFDQGRSVAEALGADPITAVLVAEARSTSGGVVRAGELGIPIWVSTGAEPFVRAILRNAGARSADVRVVRSALRLGRGAEQVVLQPIDLPDAPGSLLLYKPSLRWALAPEATDPLAVRMASQLAEALGWDVERMGTARDYWPGR